MTTKQVRDTLLYKNEESRIITDIDHREEAYIFCTTLLSGENFRCDIYDALDEVNVRGTQEALF